MSRRSAGSDTDEGQWVSLEWNSKISRAIAYPDIPGTAKLQGTLTIHLKTWCQYNVHRGKRAAQLQYMPPVTCPS